MKTFLVFIFLATSLTNALAGPLPHHEVQTKRDSKVADPSELIRLFESTVADISKASAETSMTIVTVVLDKSPQQGVVQDIISKADADFEIVYTGAMEEFLAASREELPSLMEGKLLHWESLDAFVGAKITIAVENESDQIRYQVSTLLTNYLSYSAETLQPLFDAIRE